MGLSISSAVSSFLCFLISLNLAIAVPQRQAVAPAWRVDLRTAIDGVPLPFVYNGRYEIKGPLVTSLWFTDNNTIVATFVVRASPEGNPKLPSRNPAGADLPLRLRCIFLAAATGKINGTTEWPSEFRWSKIVAAHDGRFVVQKGNQLTLYASDFSTLKDSRLPERKEIDYWFAVTSPTSMNILFVAPVDQRFTSWLWVDADTLQVLRSWEEQPRGAVSIADDKIALSGVCASLNCVPPRLQVKGLSTGWTPIAGGGDTGLQFINGDMLFLAGNALSGKPMSLIRTSGQVIFSRPQLPALGGSNWGAAVVSAGDLLFPAIGRKAELRRLM